MAIYNTYNNLSSLSLFIIQHILNIFVNTYFILYLYKFAKKIIRKQYLYMLFYNANKENEKHCIVPILWFF